MQQVKCRDRMTLILVGRRLGREGVMSRHRRKLASSGGGPGAEGRIEVGLKAAVWPGRLQVEASETLKAMSQSANGFVFALYRPRV